MGHFALGFRALFRVWTDDAFASQVGKWLGEHPAGEPVSPVAPSPTVTPPAAQPVAPTPRQPRAAITPNIRLPQGSNATAPTPASRNEALSLLAVLQRDARLIDFLKEPLTPFTDAEVGASARTIHKAAGEVIERIFGVEPLAEAAEGAKMDVPAGYDPVRYRVVGNVPGGGGPIRGTMVHPGWRAQRADVPAWNGKTDAANVLAPTEVEV